MAQEHFSPNNNIVQNSIGSAVAPTQQFHDEFEKSLTNNSYFMQGKKFHNKRYDVFKNAKYKEVHDKFNRTIDSKAFRSQAGSPNTINVLKMDEANKLLGHFVKQSKAFQREDVPIDRIKSFINETSRNDFKTLTEVIDEERESRDNRKLGVHGQQSESWVGH